MYTVLMVYGFLEVFCPSPPPFSENSPISMNKNNYHLLRARKVPPPPPPHHHHNHGRVLIVYIEFKPAAVKNT